MQTVRFPDGISVPALGQGTWTMGEDPNRRAAETAALRAGVERGLRLVDTAEMYGEGATEELLGEALAGLRDRIFLVSKAYPHNAGRAQLVRSCENSLRRLRTDHLDLYLLHWRGRVPLADTVEGMLALQAAGKIKTWGVSNLDSSDMDELIEAGGTSCATDQVLYNLGRRGPEYDLLPWLAAHDMPLMAYSPIEQGNLDITPALSRIAERRRLTPFQIALAWVLRKPGLIAIPKASSIAHVEQNCAAADVTLTQDELAELDAAYPAPRRKVALQML